MSSSQNAHTNNARVQVVRGSTNLSRDDEGATQDRSNAPITTAHDPEQVLPQKLESFTAWGW